MDHTGSSNRNSDDMAVWVPNEAFEFLQKLWKPEYQWAPVPVDRSLAIAPENIAFIESGGPDPNTPIATPQPPRTPEELPMTPGAPLPPQDTSREDQSGIGWSSGSLEPETAVTTITSSPGDITPPNSHSGVWEGVKDRRVTQIMERSGRDPGRLEDGEEGHKKAGTRSVLRNTLGGQKPLDNSDRANPRNMTKTKRHTRPKSFAVRLDLNLSVEIQLKGVVSGDITLSAETLYCVSTER
ncbi:hypothetical protein VSDG_09465 [Cytospora chrysosperma]|uniref:Uncharacterized protein n=1 Tax=Cytospora chrysosperma TaxID=252740 RepID=A0A423VAQ9_CYTCH|nr:hypothetical protein VSDG_09465 [Valsa sordida]